LRACRYDSLLRASLALAVSGIHGLVKLGAWLVRLGHERSRSWVANAAVRPSGVAWAAFRRWPVSTSMSTGQDLSAKSVVDVEALWLYHWQHGSALQFVPCACPWSIGAGISGERGAVLTLVNHVGSTSKRQGPGRRLNSHVVLSTRNMVEGAGGMRSPVIKGALGTAQTTSTILTHSHSGRRTLKKSLGVVRHVERLLD
jgi:hypothetical protein